MDYFYINKNQRNQLEKMTTKSMPQELAPHYTK
jgi:hypothetical protein